MPPLQGSSFNSKAMPPMQPMQPQSFNPPNPWGSSKYMAPVQPMQPQTQSAVLQPTMVPTNVPMQPTPTTAGPSPSIERQASSPQALFTALSPRKPEASVPSPRALGALPTTKPETPRVVQNSSTTPTPRSLGTIPAKQTPRAEIPPLPTKQETPRVMSSTSTPRLGAIPAKQTPRVEPSFVPMKQETPRMAQQKPSTARNILGSASIQEALIGSSSSSPLSPPDISALLGNTNLPIENTLSPRSLESIQSPRLHGSDQQQTVLPEPNIAASMPPELTDDSVVNITYAELKKLQMMANMKTERMMQMAQGRGTSQTPRTGLTARSESANSASGSDSSDTSSTISYERYQKVVKYYDPTGLDRFAEASEKNIAPDFSVLDSAQKDAWSAKYDSFMRYVCLKFGYKMPEGYEKMTLEQKDTIYKDFVLTSSITKSAKKYKNLFAGLTGLTEFGMRKAGMKFKEGESLVKFHAGCMDEYNEFFFQIGEDSIYNADESGGVSIAGIKLLDEKSSPMTKLLTAFTVNTLLFAGLNKIAQNEEFGETVADGIKYAMGAVKEAFIGSKSEAPAGPIVEELKTPKGITIPAPPEPAKFDLEGKVELISMAARRMGGGTEQIVVEAKVDPYADEGYDN